MKKLIIIKENSEVKVGDIAIFNNKLWVVKEINPELNIPCLNVDIHLSEKVHFYIIDDEKDLTDDCFIIGRKDKTNPNSTEKLHYIDNYYSLLNTTGDAVIATSNPELPLPQLTKEAIDLIIANNGELGEFDVDIFWINANYTESYANIILKKINTLIDRPKL